MTKEQIDILLKDEEVEPVADDGPGMIGYEVSEGLFKEFDVSNKLNGKIKEIIAFYLEQYLIQHNSANDYNPWIDRINENLTRFLSSKSQKINYLESQILEHQKQLNELSDKYHDGQTLKVIEYSWYWYINLNDLVETLKFKILKGSKIENFTVSSLNFQIDMDEMPTASVIKKIQHFRNLLDPFFYSNQMKMVYEALRIEKNIKFLQEKIDEIENENIVSSKNKVEETTDKALSEIIASDNKFCSTMPIQVARTHFEIMTTTLNKNGVPFLNKSDFEKFMQRAFLKDKSIQKIKFNFGTREKLFIVKRFYEFYLNESGKYENTTQCKKKYIELLTNNFENWNYESIKNNFGNKVKRSW